VTAITAAGNGNFSAGGTWNGGAAPGVNDTADPNGHIVTLDGDVTCQQLLNAAAGGYFLLSGSVTRTINASMLCGKAGVNLIGVDTGQVLNVNIPTGGTMDTTVAAQCINQQGGDLNIECGAGAVINNTTNYTIISQGSGALRIGQSSIVTFNCAGAAGALYAVRMERR